MALIVKPLTNRAYGFPSRGHLRRHQPHILAVIHITDNAHNQGTTAAINERDYADRAASPGPSAHIYLDRDGGGVTAIDHIKYAAWSNGDVQKPNVANGGVHGIVAHMAQGFNANECAWLEIECVGVATTAGQIAPAQMATLAQLIAAEAKRTGLHIDRTTVLTHSDINSVTRRNCAFFPTSREQRMKALIANANAIIHPPRQTVTVTVEGDNPVTVAVSSSVVTITGKNLVRKV